MIPFSHPWLLLLLLAIPILLRIRNHAFTPALPYPDITLFSEALTRRARRVNRWGATLRIGALASLIIAMAGPRWPDYGSRIPTESIAIQLLLDVSGSMSEPDFTWNGESTTRLNAAKQVLRLIVSGGTAPTGVDFAGHAHDLLGLVTFATWPETACPLTLSHSVLMGMLDDENTIGSKKLPNESHTNIGDAIAWALEPLKDTSVAQKIAILLSDGEHNVPAPALTPRQAAQLAANLGVRIYVVDVAGESSAESDSRAAGMRSLQVVATISDGRYFSAADTASLIEAVKEIDTLERQKVESFVYLRYYEAYPWFGLAALAMWTLLVVLEATVWRRIP